MLSWKSGAIEPPEFNLMLLFEELFRRLAGTGKSAVRFLSLADDRDIQYNRRWRPSSLRYCPRKQVYAALDCPQSADKAEHDLFTQVCSFDRGHVYGAWVGAYFRAMEKEGIIHSVHTQAAEGELEMVCRCPELRFAGKADVAFSLGEHDYMVEVKSKDNINTFSNVARPEKNHREQLNDYQGMAGRRAGWVFYIGPEKVVGKAEGNTTTSFKAFFHRFSGELWDKTRGLCQTLDLFYDMPHVLAPKTTETYFQCNQCAWRLFCERGLAPADLLKGGG